MYILYIFICICIYIYIHNHTPCAVKIYRDKSIALELVLYWNQTRMTFPELRQSCFHAKGHME